MKQMFKTVKPNLLQLVTKIIQYSSTGKGNAAKDKGMWF
jgi:hypothetical protein